MPNVRLRLHRLGRHPGGEGLEPSCGAMDVVQGSRVVSRVVTDCGMIPRGPQGWLAPDLSLLDDGVGIDAVRITHVHGDHVGYLPALLPYLKRSARVFMTKASAAFMEHVLTDGLRVNERRGTPVPFDMHAVQEILGRIETIARPGEVEIVPGYMDYVQPEGHVHGACSFTTRVNGRNVHYAGDRCEHDLPGVLGARPLPEEWRPHVIAVSDCTYGADPGSDTRDWNEEMARGARIAEAAASAGGVALCCTFTLHRAGAFAHELNRLAFTRRHSVFLEGSCAKLAEMANGHGSWSGRERPFALGRAAVFEGNRDRHRTRERGGCAVLTGPGMGGPGGRASWWIERILPDPDSALIFTGYCAPGSDGRRILDAVAAGATEIAVGDGPTVVPILARVAQVRLGAHDGRRKILDWFRSYRPDAAVLTHGSPEALASIESELAGEGTTLVRSDLSPTFEIDL